MLSKEEYLDNLLKGVTEQKEEGTLSEEPGAELSAGEPELPTEEFGAEPELSAEPESGEGSEEDLDALLGSVPEMAGAEPMPELPTEEFGVEPELSAEPESGEGSEEDLDVLLGSVPEMTGAEPMPELSVEEFGAMPELSAEPESGEGSEEDLDALLESVPEMAGAESIPELPAEEFGAEPELSAEPELGEGSEEDLDALLGSVPEMAGAEPMPELPAEEFGAEPELSAEPELGEGSEEDLDALLGSVPEMTGAESMPELPAEEFGAMPELSAEPELFGAEPELSAEPELGEGSEEDLDALLGSVPEMNVEEEEPEAAGDLDPYSDIGDDIEARLDVAAELPPVTEEFPEDDVMSMLEESDDSDLQEIQELLRKSDSNEAVDDSVEELLKEQPEEDLEAKILGGSEGTAEETPSEKRRRAKEEKARAKAEKIAEKKAEAEARKAEKKAQKEAAKRKKAGAGKAQDKGEGQEFDPAVLDSIVSEAGMAGSLRKEEGSSAGMPDGLPEGGEEEEPFNPLAEADGIAESPQPEAEDSDDLGIDLDNLFGGEDAGLGEEISGLPELTKEQDAGGEQEQGQKKKGFFSRLFDFLTEEDEEEEENENIKLSQENQDILNELDQEKGKKKKGKKGKKGKAGAKDEEGSEKDAKGKKAAKPKAAKPKKAPKPKKQKPPKEMPLIPERKLTFKRMLPVLLVGVSVGVLLFVFVNATVDFTDKKAARDAFYAGDYQTCYQNLFGKDLDETESIMFGKSKSILYIRLWTREYQMFAEEGDRVRGLDSLIQTVAAYPELYRYAEQWNAQEEVAAGYANILNLLKDEYGMSESQALAISKLWRDVDYTRAVIAAAEGNYGSDAPGGDDAGQGSGQEDPENPEGGQLPDFLPEEEGLGEDSFHDNR